jgi:hypothetical protein
LIGRSVRNCTRLDQNRSGIRISGRPNFGTAWDGTGTDSSGPLDAPLAFFTLGGKRLINVPGTVFLVCLDAAPLRWASPFLGFAQTYKGCASPAADTQLVFIVTYVATLLCDVSRRAPEPKDGIKANQEIF